MTRDRVVTRLAWAVSVIAVVSAGISYTAAALSEGAGAYPEQGPRFDPTLSFSGAVLTTSVVLAYALVGGLIAIKRPRNPVGWALLVTGCTSLDGGLGGYAQLALVARPEWDLPAGGLAAALGRSGVAPLLAGVFLLGVLFPNGTHLSAGWQRFTLAMLAPYVALYVSEAVAPDLGAPFAGVENPVAVGQHNNTALTSLLTVVCLLVTAAGAVFLVVRFRRSRGVEREQFKWLGLAGLAVVLTLPIGGLDAGEGVSTLPFGFALAALPVAVAIAILRHHLYNIDRIINRTFVYGVLTAGLGGVYFILIVALQVLLEPMSGGSDLAIVVTTLVVAALFLPARRRVQSVVDRHFNRRHYDATRTVEAFSARLREQIDLDTLRGELLAVVDETMQPSSAGLWLRGGRP